MENRGPRWLTIAGIISLLWNLMGVWSFVTNWQLSKTGYAGLPDVQRELWSAMPVWTWVCFCYRSRLRNGGGIGAVAAQTYCSSAVSGELHRNTRPVQLADFHDRCFFENGG
jgi:hypothetical protein